MHIDWYVASVSKSSNFAMKPPFFYAYCSLTSSNIRHRSLHVWNSSIHFPLLQSSVSSRNHLRTKLTMTKCRQTSTNNLNSQTKKVRNGKKTKHACWCVSNTVPAKRKLFEAFVWELSPAINVDCPLWAVFQARENVGVSQMLENKYWRVLEEDI